MDATTGFGPGTGQASQPDQNALFADFLKRAGALTQGDIAGADALIADIVISDLPDSTFKALADAIAGQTGLDAAKLATQLRDGREAHEAQALFDMEVSDLSIIPPVMNKGLAGQIFNRLLGFAKHFGGEHAGQSYFVRNRADNVLPIKPTDVDELLRNKRVRLVNAKGEEELVPAARWWKNWYDRYTVESVEYDPENVKQRQGITTENTWRGFAVKPRKGSWRRIKRHLHIFCGGNRTYFKYLIKYFAHLVQHPGTSPEVLIVLRSTREGVGKSTIGSIMVRIFGRHALVASSVNAVFGDFNEILADKSFVMLEEAGFPGDHKLAATIKNTITADTLLINPKHRSPYEIPNRLHFVLCTNAEWAVPAGVDARRFFVLDVQFEPPPGYFNALRAEIDNGGVEAMLYDLLRVNLDGFHPRQLPVTRALVQQQRLSADQITRWVHDCVVTGELIHDESTTGLTNTGFGQTISARQLYDAFVNWSRTQGIRHPVNNVQFGRSLRELGMKDSMSHGVRQWTVPDKGTLLAAAERRAGIRKPTP